MRRTFILINNTGIGGAERRFGRLFAAMTAADPGGTTLVVNAGLWRRLAAADLVPGNEDSVWRLPEPFERLAELLGLRGGPAFWLRKLDYVLFTVMVLARYAPAERGLFHLALGGAYVALPLMLARPDHRVVISVVSRLGDLVGARLALPLYRAALARCTVIDALSDTVREDLVQYGLAPEKIMVSAGSVIDADRFAPAPAKRPWVVFAGRLIEEKNPLLFIEALPAIRHDVPEAGFFLFGEGPLAPAVEESLSRLGLLAAVERGFRADFAPILAQARVFVSLQRRDNYPSQSLLEAMACGAASVATNVGLTSRLVDETTGIRVKPDSADLAGAVIALLRDPGRCDRLGRAARKRVLEHHSEERYRIYLNVLYATGDA